MADSLSEQFEELWRSSASAPDVFAFLRQHAQAPAPVQLAILLTDQRYRFQTNQPIPVEAYLAELSDLDLGPEGRLKLAINEFELSVHQPNSPGIQQFVLRFPEIRDALESRLLGTASEMTQTIRGPEPVKPRQQRDLHTAGRQTLGRYRLQRLLGAGSFGQVYLGYDDDLRRQVAIKVPNPERFRNAADAELFLAEARTVATLDHPNIVPVYDVGRTDDGLLFVVSRYIDGRTVAEIIKSGLPDFATTARLVAAAAKGLHQAHLRQLIHRDVKPANLLVEDSSGNCYVADFGLAIREDDYLQQDRIAGTPSYMSPEQARGEGHRLDGRSDIFSLGLVMYRMLTGRKAFSGRNHAEILHQLLTSEPLPPTEYDSAIPAELQRICLKALARRVSERYATAAEMAEDLQHWRAEPPAERDDSPVIPRGLRSFDAQDKDFFVRLLPGPRDRQGLPDSIRFWKTRIESQDVQQTFSVGLIYGPSGCGKSSLMKAGLLPRLSESITSIYVEATPEDTETRILTGLRNRFPELPQQNDLAAALKAIRCYQTAGSPARGPQPLVPAGSKVLIVIDQLEQWLHARTTWQESELIRALRQCDGGSLQAIVLVRDDFAMAAARFMDSLDIPVVQGQNFAVADLFDLSHAARVLTQFGQAFGRLPARIQEITAEQQQFVDEAVAGLAEDDKVVSVQLSLFAEMVKSKPWLPSTLQQIGGTAGVGVNFLEDTFRSRSANPFHRAHEQAARKILKALLPEVGTDIKGHMRSRAELLQASGYTNRVPEFNRLIRVLDSELRLITPTDAAAGDDGKPAAEGRYYQLTHDFLVTALRDWLSRKQRETRRGRAELRLAARTEIWDSRREHRHLPDTVEFLRISAFTDPRTRTPAEAAMMSAAARYHTSRWFLSTVVVAMLIMVAVAVRQQNRQWTRQLQSDSLIERLRVAEYADIVSIIDQLEPFQDLCEPALHSLVADARVSEAERVRARLALVKHDKRHVTALSNRLLQAAPEELRVICRVLKAERPQLNRRCWQLLEDPATPNSALLRAACAVALDAPEEARWQFCATAVADAVVDQQDLYLDGWVRGLQPVSSWLLDPLTQIYRSSTDPLRQSRSAQILAQFAADDLPLLTSLAIQGTAEQFQALLPALLQNRAAAMQQMQTQLQDLDQVTLPQVSGQAVSELTGAAAQELRSADGMVTSRFAFCQRLPLERFAEIAARLQQSGLVPVSVRPWSEGNQVRLAAVWQAGSHNWFYVTDQTAEQLSTVNSQQLQAGLIPVDVGAWRVAAGDYRFCGLWTDPPTDVLDGSLYVAVPESRHQEAWEPLNHNNFVPRTNLLLWDEYGMPLYTSVRWRMRSPPVYTDTWSSGPETYDRQELSGWCQVDVRPQLQQTCSAVWWNGSSDVSRRLTALDSADHLQAGHELAAAGFEPAIVSAVAAASGVPQVCSIWRRPAVREQDYDQLARQHAVTLIALLQLGDESLIPTLSDPDQGHRRRSWFSALAEPCGIDPPQLLTLLNNSDNSIVRCGLFALADYPPDRIPSAELQDLLATIRNRLHSAPTADLLSAAEYLETHWQTPVLPTESADSQPGLDDIQSTGWMVNSQGQKLIAIFDPAAFRMGSPGHDSDADHHRESQHRRQIARSYAIAAREVTVQDYLKFDPDVGFHTQYSPQPGCPISMVSWYDAARYCRWLSELENVPEDQMCFPPDHRIKEGLTLDDDCLRRSGYRLPTEAEWEYACRAGTTTPRYFGHSPQLLPRYAWMANNSDYQSKPVGTRIPNDWGLFDMYGNLMEWCLNPGQHYPTDIASVHQDQFDTSQQLEDSGPRALRGGAFLYQPSTARSAQRHVGQIGKSEPYAGFRIVRTIPAPDSGVLTTGN